MNVIKLKGCRRCGGDLFLERDFDGTNITCLQCGADYTKRRAPPILSRSMLKKIAAR